MSAVAFTVVPSPSHVDPTHPEHPRRLEGLAQAASAAFPDALLVVTAAPASEDSMLAVHSAAHLDFLRRACDEAPAIIDYAPTYVARDSLSCALLAAGGTLGVLQAVLEGGCLCGFAAIRPPGHHATPTHAMGFCLFNNIAIAARAAQRAGLERVMIVDFDVHHGNGTQEAFDEDPSVLYISTHEQGIYPGTGRLEERGRGAADGLTVNLPLPAYTGDETFAEVASAFFSPLARRFAPDLLLVSAGFDAHWLDPLASLQLTTGGYHRLATDLTEIARDTCGGRIVFVLEGGYDPAVVREGVLATVAGALGLPAPLDRLGPAPVPAANAAHVLRAARVLHGL
ncbi:MAG TPA: histone deacetylase [Anaerolineales bacterium]|nr:histone deacetylase [Anaerolineales bacterium]